MKAKIIFWFAALSLFTIILLFNSCTETTVTAPPEKSKTGVTGRIIDTAGVPIEGAKLFCLFNQYYLPPGALMKNNLIKRINKSSGFEFELFNNFPNPFSTSTFIRFSLPENCIVTLKIKSKISPTPVTLLQDTLAYGLYQFYPDSLIEKFNLLNGSYEYSLNAKGISGEDYNAMKTFFIISDRGKPYAVSGSSGEYYFNYEHALIGDTLRIQSNEFDEGATYQEIPNNIVLLFEKEGYYPKLIDVPLYPNILLNQDVILEKVKQ